MLHSRNFFPQFRHVDTTAPDREGLGVLNAIAISPSSKGWDDVMKTSALCTGIASKPDSPSTRGLSYSEASLLPPLLL